MLRLRNILVIFSITILENEAGFTKFQTDFLKAHNDLRKKHHVEPLTLDPAITKEAEDAAIEAIANYEKTGQLQMKGRDQHSNSNDIMWGMVSPASMRLSASQIVDPWVKEGAKHNFNLERYQPASAHFTQMIWKSTDELGVANVTKKVGKGSNKKHVTVVVIRYVPGGNIDGEDIFADNVQRP